ncbi:MAG: S8 family serine peptidase [Chloroflexota bacterium]
MKKVTLFFVALVVGVSFFGTWRSVRATAPSAWQTLPARVDTIDPALRSTMNALRPNETITVIVTLRHQADLSRVRGVDRAARLQGVIRALQVTSDSTQVAMMKSLNAYRINGSVRKFTSFWIFNGFSVTATPSAIAELSKRSDVYSITSDALPIVPSDFGTPEPNLSVVNAPALWELGFTGQGVVVASMDSGVDVSHPDLASRWRGGTNSWYDPFGQHPTAPVDVSGHGTWTTGIMVGGDAGGTTVGVAPDAQWIAVKVFDDQGGSTATAIHQGFQWLLDPDGDISTDDAPHVINNSWSFANPGCNLDFEADLQSLRAAGILPIFAAGNGGPSANTSYSPANNPSAFAVGAIDNDSQSYYYSSHGPTSCGGSSGPFPELVAPGVTIHTTGLSETYTTNSGTSFAAPHVAGGLALLLSAFPDLSVDQQADALIASAFDLGAVGPDDTFGYGSLDLSAAYQYLLLPPTATATASPTVTPTATATFTPTATPTFTPTATATSVPTFTPTVTATPVPQQMHIGDLDAFTSFLGGKWNITVNIFVHNAKERPVARATVVIRWISGLTGTASCVTNNKGICQIKKSGISTRVTSARLRIVRVTRAPLVYNSQANHDPDGNSTGTVILVSRPQKK